MTARAVSPEIPKPAGVRGRPAGHRSGRQRVYGFPRGEQTRLERSGTDEFFARGHRGDLLRFLRDPHGWVVGLVLNPGTWGLPARKLP